jgi:hypothetical protein
MSVRMINWLRRRWRCYHIWSVSSPTRCVQCRKPAVPWWRRWWLRFWLRWH